MKKDVEKGKCSCCGRMSYLRTTSFKYPIKCECCDDVAYHTVVIEHCGRCKPKEPKYINLVLSTNLIRNPIKFALSILKLTTNINSRQIDEVKSILSRTEYITQDGITIPSYILTQELKNNK